MAIVTRIFRVRASNNGWELKGLAPLNAVFLTQPSMPPSLVGGWLNKGLSNRRGGTMEGEEEKGQCYGNKWIPLSILIRKLFSSMKPK